MDEFLKATGVIDADHPEVRAKARELRGGETNPVEIARRCFEWVRDEISHSRDHDLPELPVSASETLRAGAGLCFSKSHLLAALLRANGVHTGFCYQRLSRDGDGAPFALHGLNAVRLNGLGWCRIDARGDRNGIRTLFTPPFERLAYTVSLQGESNLPEIWPYPIPVVLDAMRAAADAGDFFANPPDVPVWTELPAYEPVPPPEPGQIASDANDPGD